MTQNQFLTVPFIPPEEVPEVSEHIHGMGFSKSCHPSVSKHSVEKGESKRSKAIISLARALEKTMSLPPGFFSSICIYRISDEVPAQEFPGEHRKAACLFVSGKAKFLLCFPDNTEETIVAIPGSYGLIPETPENPAERLRYRITAVTENVYMIWCQN